MRKTLLGSLAGLFTAAGLAMAQADAGPTAPPAPADLVPVPAETIYEPTVIMTEVPAVPRIWADTEYLLWWVKNGPSAPPMLTSGNPALPTAGVPGTPGTTVLGNNDFNYGTASGIRFNLGAWLNRDRTVGIESSSFLLEQTAAGSGFNSNGTPGSPTFFAPAVEVGVPLGAGAFANPPTGPGIVGTANFASTSRLWGSDINLTRSIIRSNRFSASILGGFRYLDLNETMSYATNAFVPAVPGLSQSTSDYWGTQNRFYGGQIGGKFEWHRGRFFVNNTTKVALGDTHETIAINGQSVLNTPGVPSTITGGGVYTGPSNIGRTKSDQFTVVPEIGLNAGIQLTPSIRLYAGYTFIYWSNVARPGDQVDNRVDFVNTPPRAPVALNNHTDFWAHGVNFGLSVRY